MIWGTKLPHSVYAQTDDECFPPDAPIAERYSSEMHWSPDAKWLAIATLALKDDEYSCSTDTKLQIYDAATNQVVFTYPHDDIIMAGLAWSPDSSRLVATDNLGIVRIWDTADWKLVGSYKISSLPLLEATWHPYKNLLAVAGNDGIIYVLNPDNGQIIQQVNIGKNDPMDLNLPIGYLEWSPDGTKLGVGRIDESLLILGAENLEVIRTILPGKTLNPHIVYGRWSPDSKQMLVTTVDTYDTTVWDIETGNKGLTLKGHTSYLNDMAWSPSGKLIVTSSADATIRIWNAATGQQLKVFTAPDGVDETLHLDWSIKGKIAYGYVAKSHNGIEPQQIGPQIISYSE